MKRSNGEGSYTRLPSGSWRCQLMDGYKENGRPNMLSFTAPTKAEVREKVSRYKADKAAGRQQVPNIGFTAWAEDWYRQYQPWVQSSTYCNYKYTLKALTARFGDRPLTDIGLSDINLCLADLVMEGYSKSMVSKCKAMMMQIFTAAEEQKLITDNPTVRSKIRHRKDEPEPERKRGTERDAFTEREVRILMEKLPDDLLGNSIRVLLITGMRVQELLALCTVDIEEDGSVIHVRHAVKMVDGVPRLGVPKSERGLRDIPVAEEYRPYVRRMVDQGAGLFLWATERAGAGLVGVGAFRERYYKLLDTIPGVRRLSPHCLRHTYVTWLEAKGVPLEIIARLVGHTKVRTTDGYTHTSLDTLAQAVARMDGEVAYAV